MFNDLNGFNHALAGDFETFVDFNKPGVVIAMRRGIDAVQTIRRFMPHAAIRQFNDEATVTRGIVAGHAHAMVGSAPLPTFDAMENPQQSIPVV